MPRRVRGVLVVEGVQTGDGRVIAEGAVTWADLPLPLAWLREEQHGDLLAGAVQVGTIDTITRSDSGAIEWTGTLDDGQPDGAEMVRRMEAGTAPQGNRWGVSIDPDDWEVEVIVTEQEAEGTLLLVASGEGAFVSMRAAAGDPDPGPGGGDQGTTLIEDSADAILERYTRLRIRGATNCAIPAFDGAYMELDGEAADVQPTEPAPAPEAVAAGATPTRPPAAWFTVAEPEEGDDALIRQIDGGWAVPLTITDDGQVFGHLARAGQPHRGYTRHVVPPTSTTAYAHFHVGEVVCDDGSRVATGALTVGCEHAPESCAADGARDFYAHSGMGWADVRVVDGQFGPWVCGALRPGLTDEDLRVLRALTLSGDWRRVGGNLELIGALAVNSPGFPIAREALAASSMRPVAVSPRMTVVDGEPQSLVAAATVQRCSECAERARLEADRDDLRTTMQAVADVLARIDRRTAHLVPSAVDALSARVHAGMVAK